MKVTVKDVMVTQYPPLRPDMSVSEAVRCLKKAAKEEGRRIFGMLVTDENNRLAGMLSMFDILLYIQPKHIHIWGVMDDVDIAGLLENTCDRIKPLRVDDLMTTGIISVTPDTHLLVVLDIMEGLSMYRFGAVLITEPSGKPAGVVSKTDLTLAYRHGVDSMDKAETIMASPVQTCHKDEFLEKAIRTLIFSQVHRIFVHDASPDEIVGVLSLSDAARVRSGSCQACVSSRIRVEDHE